MGVYGAYDMLRSTLAVFLVIHFMHDEISVTWMLHTEFSVLFTNRLDVNIHLCKCWYT